MRARRHEVGMQIDWAMIFRRARWRTICVRRVTCRRRPSVCSSGTPDLRQEATRIKPGQNGRVDHVLLSEPQQ